MKFSASLFAGLTAINAIAAAPLAARNNGGGKKSSSSGGVSDVTILQYALTLEHLENTFYMQALDKFDDSTFSSAGFNRSRFAQISRDESSHVAFLSSALESLGVTPTAACTYDFGYSDINGFVATSSILEGVGVSAYLGAAASIASDAYLTAAASILTVEARHNAYVRGELDEVPFPEPYDIPLDFNEVYSLASLFITSCPSSNPKLPVKAFPALTGTLTGSDMVKLTPADSSVLQKADGQLYAVWIGYPTGNQVGEFNQKTMEVTVPQGFYGQNYVVLSTSQNATDSTIVAGPAIVEIAGAYQG